MMRRIWVPGLQYEGETPEQMDAREMRWREEDARIDAEEKRLAAWKARPWWEDSRPLTPRAGCMPNAKQGEHVMRAKMKISTVDKTNIGKEGDTYRSIKVRASAVAKTAAYPADGSDEDNSFARWSPSADLDITINNPNLFEKIAVGDVFYVDFHRAVPVANG